MSSLIIKSKVEIDNWLNQNDTVIPKTITIKSNR